MLPYCNLAYIYNFHYTVSIVLIINNTSYCIWTLYIIFFLHFNYIDYLLITCIISFWLFLYPCGNGLVNGFMESEINWIEYKNCLNGCEEKWVWKMWGQWTSRRSQLFTWTSCGDVIVTAQTIIVTIIRNIRMCIHISHTKYRPLAEHSYAKPWLQLKENREYQNEWSLCYSLLVQKIGGQDWYVCV